MRRLYQSDDIKRELYNAKIIEIESLVAPSLRDKSDEELTIIAEELLLASNQKIVA